ncbi:1-acyl-sn-glycerol-3-phosphate acyltransferase [Pseudomonas sichuanensis]|uniref:lysophospholipid acyltransferase family protein n=1 Tax=Pseudomonas sichuanensis TaxID=2213015 RepID=UPI002447C1DD|nr:lysophospholipid acyltransferase family protein [Pseudomonas sichuanensis]MDH0730346.1 1-acyl-sn-glycerol-3-phosphate acyltransferase [Pseudomonas sichuanensis]MDH1585817.1 1-acyl-sn-glycerol-3-phosphate acyltransferase [Pseudomonas sichuanensis]MDH1595086.1 1-acyl-sn-glycerol-3-phosphate acyltransferase [Pseudomonas sichuanensis]MDH1597895.1 1-acyl-sn-glycerol-3-phosphate acyltransferase [Pseudomonas sichuanensis]
MLYLLRMLLLGLHFLLVGVLGLVIGLLRPFNPDNSRLFARLYSVPAAWFMGIKVKAEVGPLWDQPPGCVIIANHQSNYDLFIIGQVVPRRTVAIGKKSLGWVPLFGQLFWLGGNVLIDRKNSFQARQALQATTRTLQHDTSIWVFPEGTRNPGEQLLPFKKGAFHMALEAGVPIVPVCVSRYTRRMGLNSWRRRTVIIRSLAPIATAGLTQQDLPALIEQCQAQMQHCIDHMEHELPGNRA